MSEPTTETLEDTYPQAVLWSWENRYKALGFVADVDQQLADKDTEIERLQAALDKAKARHRELGIERGEHEENADAFLEMVADWCRNHGDLPLPPEPVVPPPAPEPDPLGVPVTRMADVLVSNGDPRALETRELAEVDPVPDPLIDPDCRDGKHGSCIGGACDCVCHERDVDPLEPLAPGVIDSRADVTTPDADQEGDRDA